jgi:eukaryotic-like serine/threonine-protein kinase
MRVRLHVLVGPASGRVVELVERSRLVFGRGVDVDVSIADSALSRKHVAIELEDAVLIAHDLGSKHGMHVNGQRAAGLVELHHGDRVQIGESIIHVEVAGAVNTVRGVGAAGATMHSGEGAVAETVSLPPDYELIRPLGRGAMGCVVSARHRVTQVSYAIKQILPRVAMSPQMRAMFLREAEVQKQLQHPNIVTVFDLIESDGCFNIVMELVDGTSAEALLAGGQTVEPGVAIEIGIQALAGLAHAHARNIVHRDIKEGNLMLTRTADGTLAAKVSDFGLAKNFVESGASGMTSDDAIGGTLPYMAREQLLDFRYVKPPADIFALGATLYRLLTGCYPRDYPPGANWVVIALETPILPIRERLSGRVVPPALCEVIDRALATSVEERYPSAVAFSSALRGLART